MINLYKVKYSVLIPEQKFILDLKTGKEIPTFNEDVIGKEIISEKIILSERINIDTIGSLFIDRAIYSWNKAKLGYKYEFYSIESIKTNNLPSFELLSNLLPFHEGYKIDKNLSLLLN